jgi:predicted hydrocarbon binding protein
LKGEARKKEVDDFLSVVLTLNQELVGASSSPQKAERSRRDAYEVRDDGTFEAGGRAGERAFRAKVGLEADRLLDWNGRKLGEGLERVMEDVYQRLMRDRRGIILDDAKSVRSEDVREAYKGGLLGRMGMVKLAGESLETAR